jgi:glycosyltransferase involved in cell wall biosynthesis
MPARFSPLKGHHVLLKALALLKAQGKAAHVLFVGGKGKEDPFQKDLEQRTIQQNVGENVSFVPFTADLRPFYALATCVVVPSVVPEGFGRVIGEAMACGRVVIASHHGAASELLQDPEKGGGQEGALEQLFRPGDSQHLADLLAQVLALSPQEREEKGKRARLRIQQHFSLHAFRESTLALYEACAASCNTFPSMQGNL